jgi:hypothetical protein
LGEPGKNPRLCPPQLNVTQGVTTSSPLTPPRTFGIEIQYKFF